MKSLSKFKNQLSCDKAISIYTTSVRRYLRVSIRHFVRVNPNINDINRFFIFKLATTPPTIKRFYYDSICNKKPLRKVHYVKKQKPIITIYKFMEEKT